MREVPARTSSDARLRAMARQMASRDRGDEPDPGDDFAGWRGGSIEKGVRALTDLDALRLDTFLEEEEKLAAAEEACGGLDN